MKAFIPLPKAWNKGFHYCTKFVSTQLYANRITNNLSRSFVQRKPHPCGTLNSRHPVGKQSTF